MGKTNTAPLRRPAARLARQQAAFGAAVATPLLAAALICGCRPRIERDESNVEALPQARAILGPAVDWHPLSIDADTVNSSMAARRQAGWATVQQALQRVTITNPLTGEIVHDDQGREITIPMWQTWYELNELRAMFADVWSQLTPEQQAARKSDAAVVDAVMRVHHQRKLLSKWTNPQEDGSTRFERLLSQVTSPAELAALNGVSGQGYVLHSPQLVRHYLLHYAEVMACNGHDDDFSTGDADKDFATCLGGDPFPVGSATLKATWNSATDGVAAFDTTAAGLAATFKSPRPTWKPYNQDKLAFPTPSEIYTSYVFEDDRRGPAFKLTGLHITTKDIKEWLWVTLWWAPNPGDDFGEDRPPTLTTLGPAGAESVWSNYKMCVASTFAEGDAQLVAAGSKLTTETLLTSSDRSLRAALAASYHFSKPTTYCSNPYIEFQPGMANTNCIGCHQLAGPFVSGAMMAPVRDRIRRSFMTDFLWSFESQRESVRGVFDEIVNDN